MHVTAFNRFFDDVCDMLAHVSVGQCFKSLVMQWLSCTHFPSLNTKFGSQPGLDVTSFQITEIFEQNFVPLLNTIIYKH